MSKVASTLTKKAEYRVKLTQSFITKFLKEQKPDPEFFKSDDKLQSYIKRDSVKEKNPQKMENLYKYLVMRDNGLLPEKTKKKPYQKHKKSDHIKSKKQHQKSEKFQKKEETQEEKDKKEEIKNNQNVFYEEMVKKNQENDKKVLSKLRFSLNIISPDNIEKVIKDILENLEKFQSKTSLPEFYDLLVKKALSDKKYVNTFSQLFNAIFEKSHDMKKDILLELNQLFDGVKEIHVVKKKIEDMDMFERESYDDQRKGKFGALGNFLGSMFVQGVIPSKIIQMCFLQLLGNYFGKYAQDLQKEQQQSNNDNIEGKKQQNEENKEQLQQYSYKCEVYLELLLIMLEKVGRKFDERHNKKKFSSVYTDQIREENLWVKKIGNYMVKGKENIDEIQKIEFNEKISIQGIFYVLDMLVEKNIAGGRMEALISNLKTRREENWEERMLVKDNTAKTKQEVLEIQKQQKIQKLQQQKQQEENEYEDEDEVEEGDSYEYDYETRDD